MTANDPWTTECPACGHVLAAHEAPAEADDPPPCTVDGCFCHFLKPGQRLLSEPSVLYTDDEMDVA